MITRDDIEAHTVVRIHPRLTFVKKFPPMVDSRSETMSTELHNLRVAIREALKNTGWEVEGDDD